jgi:hypothetical protein
MSKKKSSSSSSLTRSIIDIDPEIIYFTHSRVRPFFTGCNKRIEQTLDEIREGVTKISDIPLITVISNDGNYFSLNNRRLYLFKTLKKEGLLTREKNMIRAQLKPALEKEKTRYLPGRCSLEAKLMKEFSGKSEGKEGDEREDGEEEEQVETSEGLVDEKFR